MTENNEADRGRLSRFLGSVFLIWLGLNGILSACLNQGVSPVFPLTVFVIFLVASAIIIALIAGRLYAQHEIRRFKFDIANLILITTLASLPFAAANIFWNQIEQSSTEPIKDDALWITIIIAAVLFFFMFPALFIAEALITWWRAFTRRAKK